MSREVVTVPAGVADGHVLKLTGRGDASSDMGPIGDIIVKISIREHHAFKREMYDVFSKVKVSVS